jgi:hypothetical protein
MRLLIGASQFFGLVTLSRHRAHVQRIHKDRGVYTGISWNSEHIYVASLNNRGIWNDEKSSGPEVLLKYDHNLQLLESIEMVDARDIHQIYWYKDRLLICDTGHNRMLSYPHGAAWTLPDEGLKVQRAVCDRHHLNTIWSDGGPDIWVIVWYPDGRHRRSKKDRKQYSEAWRVDFESKKILSRHAVGKEAHNICVRDGTLITCSSADERLNIFKGQTLVSSTPLSAGYPRGLCHLGKMTVIGTAARGTRRVRHFGNAEILLLKQSRVWRRYPIRGAGQIYTLRVLDGVDWAHQGDWGPRCPVLG